MARLDPQEKSAVGDGGLGDFGRQDRPLKAHTSDADFSASTQRKDLIPQRSTAKFLFYAVGTFVSFMVFGIFQERITRGIYGTSDRFTYTASMVFIQCVINAIFARIVMRLSKEPKDSTPRTMYGISSLSYLGAMLSSNQALQYVSYPTQVLGKSCKPIPVMVFGALFAHKRYSFRKYLFTLMIVVGVAIFFYEAGKGHSKQEIKAIGYGEALLVFSLLMDGVTGATQDRMRSNHKTQANSMMMWMNIFSSIILLAYISVTGEIVEVGDFINKYPYVLEHLLTFSLCSAVGQYFIFATVADFGPLPCSIITTTRKFFTILFSVIFYSNPMSGPQWLATCLVFAGLVCDTKYGKSKH
ncbi:hypothetical protein RvY_11971 [Ramazzottius varieornatus]|uniref:Sugar phosphate transporter domain-containing protein n=1 Tax=Ramazzottius varieornatus TaxID=947166 RepID=A0A1D1VHZ2_RAMVA|nr:hypothetical protein RvY_11971 [Ramazzottius varieornatus]